MITNCICREKEENWVFEGDLDCWYVCRTCDHCNYYWEGPDYTKDNRYKPPIATSDHFTIEPYNCNCLDKEEAWHFHEDVNRYYVNRSCNQCQYRWDGYDDHPKDVDTQQPKAQSSEFLIFCFDDKGNYGNPRKSDTIDDLHFFCELNKHSHAEIKVVTTSDDAIVLIVKNGKYVYPESWLRFNVS